jgi:hypothetical protein
MLFKVGTYISSFYPFQDFLKQSTNQWQSLSRPNSFSLRSSFSPCPMTGRQKTRIKAVGAAFYPCCIFCQSLVSEGSLLGSVRSRWESGVSFKFALTASRIRTTGGLDSDENGYSVIYQYMHRLLVHSMSETNDT